MREIDRLRHNVLVQCVAPVPVPRFLPPQQPALQLGSSASDIPGGLCSALRGAWTGASHE
eukprot:4074145-Alexandrium_andersonii.AAC.1